MTRNRNPLAVLAILFMILLPAPGQSALISITPPLSTVGVGDTFSVNIHVAQAGDISPWQFDLKYNPLVLQAQSITEGSSGFSLLSEGFIDQTSGLISGTAGLFSGLPPAPSDGDLAVVHFKALGLGISPLQLQNLLLNFDSNVPATNASVSVVPLPGTAILMGAGGLLLLMVWAIGRWRTEPGTIV